MARPAMARPVAPSHRSVAGPRAQSGDNIRQLRPRGPAPATLVADPANAARAKSAAHEPEKQTVRHISERANPGRLEGSSLSAAAAATAMGGGMRQNSTIVLRLRAGGQASGRENCPHQIEYRAHIFHNGTDVLRYSLYQDPDGCHGFPGREQRASYDMRLSERFVVEATADAPAELHIRYEGQIQVHNIGKVRFKGTLVLLGSGKAQPGRPHLDGAGGRADFGGGCVTVGVW